MSNFLDCYGEQLRRARLQEQARIGADRARFDVSRMPVIATWKAAVTRLFRP
jgi:hypothetical protein